MCDSSYLWQAHPQSVVLLHLLTWTCTARTWSTAWTGAQSASPRRKTLYSVAIMAGLMRTMQRRLVREYATWRTWCGQAAVEGAKNEEQALGALDLRNSSDSTDSSGQVAGCSERTRVGGWLVRSRRKRVGNRSRGTSRKKPTDSKSSQAAVDLNMMRADGKVSRR